MSLLKKASIITTPTAYAEDYLYSIKPAYWTIANGKASSDGTQTSASEIYQTNVLSVGKLYRLSFNVLDYVTGNVRIRCGLNSDTFRFANGTYSVDKEATGDSTLRIQADANFVGSIDNISVKEITDADFDFDRNSTGTRVRL